MKDIYCICFSGHPLTIEIRTFLFDIAQYLFLKKENRKTFSETFVEGWISTDFKSQGMGDIYGCVFNVEVWCDQYHTDVKFLCRPTDLKIGEDLFWDDSPEFIEIVKRQREKMLELQERMAKQNYLLN